MTREQAIDLARRFAKAKPQSYYSEPFQPHEWVIDAIVAAYLKGYYEAKPGAKFSNHSEFREQERAPLITASRSWPNDMRERSWDWKAKSATFGIPAGTPRRAFAQRASDCIQRLNHRESRSDLQRLWKRHLAVYLPGVSTPMVRS